MAKIIAGVGTSHTPAIGAAIDNGKTEDAYWSPLFKGYEPAKTWIAEVKPDVVIYFEAADLEELEPFFTSLPTGVVVDHMGRPDVKLGTDHPQFKRFLRFMADNENVWSKVSCPERLTVQGPPWDDVVSYARAIVEQFPDRVLWGTDWPHPNVKPLMPDDGALVDFIPRIAVTPELQHKLLVDNPMRLYWAD